MRTNIEIDDELMARAMEATGLNTKKGVVEEALRQLIQLHEQSRIRELRGQLRWDDGPDVIRERGDEYSG